MDDWLHLQLEEEQLQVANTDLYFIHSWLLGQFKDRINQVYYNHFDFFLMPRSEE